MMEPLVKQHYASPDLAQRIRAGILKMGKNPDDLATRDLAAVDQLHTGGAPATIGLTERAALPSGSIVLDAGCGIGGSSRLLAEHFGYRVEGIDLAGDFIDTAVLLTQWCGLDGGIRFRRGSVLDLPFEGGCFDAVLCQHILMNIEDKSGALAEFHRVLQPGGRLLLHEITRGEGPEPAMPVPWASDPAISVLTPWSDLDHRLSRAGFQPDHVSDETEHSAAWWKMVNTVKRKKGAGPLNPGLVFGEDADRFGPNMEKNFSSRSVCCIEAILTRP